MTLPALLAWTLIVLYGGSTVALLTAFVAGWGIGPDPDDFAPFDRPFTQERSR